MSRHFDFIETPIVGLLRIDRKLITDNRGFFSRFFCADEFKQIELEQPIAQMNHTLTRQKGSIRGMHFHYQPHAETKIVSCIHGEVLDVAVDIRKNSPTFLNSSQAAAHFCGDSGAVVFSGASSFSGA